MANCVLTLDGNKINIQVLQDRDELTLLMVRLNALRMAANDFKIGRAVMLSGFVLEQWVGDIRTKLEILVAKEEEKELNMLEGKLKTLLSNETKVSQEIDDIESLIKG